LFNNNKREGRRNGLSSQPTKEILVGKGTSGEGK